MRAALCVCALLFCCARAQPVRMPTGALLQPLGTLQPLDPELAGFPSARAGQPGALARSPDGKLLLTLTTGFNRIDGSDGKRRWDVSSEWLFVHALAPGQPPRKLQALAIPNAFLGLAWSADSKRFYASGGMDDVVHEYALGSAGIAEVLPPIPLGHAAGLGIDTKPMAAGLALSGSLLIVANYENDSLSVIDLAQRKKIAELELRPGKLDPSQRGKPGGEYPLAVVVASNGHAFVACVRDDEIVEVELSAAPRVVRRMPGVARPVALVADGARVYALSSTADEVVAIEDGAVVARWPVLDEALSHGMRGANPSALIVHQGALYVALGALNLVSRIPLGGAGARGLFPTGWYPAALAAGEGQLYVANARSVAGPNPGACRNAEQTEGAGKSGLAAGSCRAANQYMWQLVKGSLQSFPLAAPAEGALAQGAAPSELFAFLRTRIKHVIYVIKENRTYDQVLGDLAGADGDPRLTLFPQRITPNHHALARQFVTLDRFMASGNTSGDGWNWSTAGRASHITELEEPVQYAKRGLSYDYEGQNRNVSVAQPMAERRAREPSLADDDDLLPGGADVAAPGTGYLWTAALKKGLSLRNYGFFGDDLHYDPKRPGFLRPSHDAFAQRALQFVPNEAELKDVSDPFFRNFDQRFADFWNEREWAREFDGYEQRGDLPALSLVRLAHDHFGSFGAALDGVDTPDTQMADNDYALGLLVEKVAHSRYAQDTVILSVEDDAQDGPDHVDAHRTVFLAAGAHVRQGAVISAERDTVDLIRTLEELLGLAPMSLLDANARPLEELFEREERPWSFTAQVPAVLRSTQLPLPAGPVEQPRGSSGQWSKATEGMDFDTADALDTAAFNAALVQLLGER